MNTKPRTLNEYRLKTIGSMHKSDCRWSWTNKQWLKWLRDRERQRRIRRIREQVVRPMMLDLYLYGTSRTEILHTDETGKQTHRTLDLRLGHDGTVHRVDGAR